MLVLGRYGGDAGRYGEIWGRCSSAAVLVLRRCGGDAGRYRGDTGRYRGDVARRSRARARVSTR